MFSYIRRDRSLITGILITLKNKVNKDLANRGFLTRYYREAISWYLNKDKGKKKCGFSYNRCDICTVIRLIGSSITVLNVNVTIISV